MRRRRPDENDRRSVGRRRLTAAGVGGLVVATKLSIAARGETRICGADAAIEAQLRGLGYNNLFSFDRTVEASLAALFAGAVRDGMGLEASLSARPESLGAAVNDRTCRRIGL